jgi:cell division septal protein FtsQ
MAIHGGARGPRLRILSSILLTLAVLGIPGAVVAWGRTTSSFTIGHVVLSGAHMVPKKEARRALEKAFIGENLFAVGADEVLQALRRQCYVAGVEVDRDFPATLRVRLVEHRPALALLSEGRWFVVSDEGRVVCEAASRSAAAEGTPAADAAAASDAGGSPEGAEDEGASGETAERTATADRGAEATGTLAVGPAGPTESRLPRLETGTAPKIGATIDDRRVTAALTALRGLPKGLRRRVALVEVSERLQVAVTMLDDLVVQFGYADRLGDKVLALRAVAAAYRTRGLRPSYIDVSVPERPLGRPLLKG